MNTRMLPPAPFRSFLRTLPVGLSILAGGTLGFGQTIFSVSSSAGGSIYRTTTSGSTSLLVNTGSYQWFRMSVDDSNQHIYLYGSSGGNGVVGRVNIDGTGFTQLYSASGVQVRDGQHDTAGGKIYFFDTTPSASIKSIALNGSGVQAVVSGISSGAGSMGLGLDLTNSYLYYTVASSPYDLSRSSLTGTGGTVIVSGNGYSDVKPDPANNRLVLSLGTQVFTRPAVGGAHTALFNGDAPGGVFYDVGNFDFLAGSSTLYFTKLNYTTSKTTLWSINFDGTGLTQLSSTLDNNSTIAVSASAIPEPSTYAVLFGAAALGFTLWRRRGQQRQPVL